MATRTRTTKTATTKPAPKASAPKAEPKVRTTVAASAKVIARYEADSARVMKATGGDATKLTEKVLETLDMSHGKALRMIAFAAAPANERYYEGDRAGLAAAVVKFRDAGLSFPDLWARTLRPAPSLKALYAEGGGKSWIRETK